MKIIFKSITAAVFAVGVLFAGAASAQDRVEVGILSCDVSGGTGFIFGSSKSLDCIFERPDLPDERYRGSVRKFGLDIGTTTDGAIVWAVFAPTSNLTRGALNGSYGGVSAEATVGVGLGANALIGGNSRSVVLQPLSVSGQEGLNFAVGIAEITLTDVY